MSHTYADHRVQPFIGPIQHPIPYPFEEPTPEQQREITAWRAEVARLAADRRYDTLDLSDEQRGNVRKLSRDGMCDLLDRTRRHLNVDLVVNHAPEGMRLTDADPTLDVVNHIGDLVSTWADAQPEMRDATVDLVKAIKVLQKDSEVVRRYAPGHFRDIAINTGEARRSVLEPLLDQVVGASKPFTVAGVVVVNDRNEVVDVDVPSALKIITEQVNAASRLIPDRMVGAADSLERALYINPKRGRGFYIYDANWTDAQGRPTAILMYDPDSDSHPVMR